MPENDEEPLVPVPEVGLPVDWDPTNVLGMIVGILEWGHAAANAQTKRASEFAQAYLNTGSRRDAYDAITACHSGVHSLSFMAMYIAVVLKTTTPGEPYDFEKWVADLKEKSTPEAKALAGDVLKALDILIGAWK